jgi:hypothetical protein
MLAGASAYNRAMLLPRRSMVMRAALLLLPALLLGPLAVAQQPPAAKPGAAEPAAKPPAVKPGAAKPGAVGAQAGGTQAGTGAAGVPFVTGPAAQLPPGFAPDWAAPQGRRFIDVLGDPRRSAADRGTELAGKLSALEPGDVLRIHGGTYSLPGIVTLDLRGTAGTPIRIIAQPGERVVLTRADASQNVLNIGALKGEPAAYLVLQGLEITGGSQGLRLLGAHHVWIDGCHIHHTGEAALTANSADTSFLVLTRNEIHHTGGTGEGMYLGANDGVFATNRSLVALNHVHHTAGSQGDGIELKQGSWGNRIVANHVHHTPYPSILVYGTGGRAVNVIERNVCHDSGDNLLQVQGEAVVANNLLLRGAAGIHSHDHQGKTRDLRVVHNTIVTSGPATDLFSWNGRPGMVFANNAVYSLAGPSLSFPNGSAGVTLAGNVVLGTVAGCSAGYAEGRGLTDFVRGDWRAPDADFRPSPSGALVNAADAGHPVSDDLAGLPRRPPADVGCHEAR